MGIARSFQITKGTKSTFFKKCLGTTGLEEQLEFSVNDSVMYVSLRILDEDIPELDKLILLQLYNASYHSSISDQSLLPIIVSANDDSGGILRFSDSFLSLFISEDIMPTIQVGIQIFFSNSRDRTREFSHVSGLCN